MPMLPIVPALLILLLQGPAGLERLAVGGHLPEALARLNLAAPSGERTADHQVDAGSNRALAALSALQRTNRDFAAALQHLLHAAAEALEPEISESDRAEATAPAVVPRAESFGKPSDGFLLVGRTRDGPA
ncbi:MAG: hypothetical protein SNJ74_12220 [Fimbriimonadaceae bacterium]